jgi:MFS family permease
MAMTQGLFAKLVAEHSPDELRGSAFGLFNIATGLVLLVASVVAGLLWTAFGSTAPFLAGAAIAAVAAAMVVVARGSLVAKTAYNE